VHEGETSEAETRKYACSYETEELAVEAYCVAAPFEIGKVISYYLSPVAFKCRKAQLLLIIVVSQFAISVNL